jgi:tRNA-dihydrouridine synthase B
MNTKHLLSTPANIGPLVIPNRVILAPLAGITDAPFRRICQEQGAGLTFVEMISAVALNYENRRTIEMARRHASEKILGAQLEGSDPVAIAQTVRTFDSMGFDTIDINMGCPVRKVVNAGGGSGLLRFPDLISRILDAARAATSKPLSVKYRLGFTRDAITVEDTTERAIQAGFQMVTIHGRTRSEDYSNSVDYEGIKLGVQRAHTPATNKASLTAFGNGNVFSVHDANLMMESTGADGVMVSRGALGNPWIFTEILANKKLDVTIEEWLALILRHISYQQENYGDTSSAAIMMRKHLLWYAKGFPGTKILRGEICKRNTLDDMRALFRDFSREHPPHLVRHFSPSHAPETN